MCAVTRCDTPTINAMIQPHPSTTVTVKTNISTAIYNDYKVLFKKKINILLSISRITKSYIFVHWLTIASSLHNSALLLIENVKIQETSRVHDVGVSNTFTSHCTLFVCCWRRRKRHMKLNWYMNRTLHLGHINGWGHWVGVEVGHKEKSWDLPEI